MMKQRWTQMLAWIAAIAIAVLLAMAGPEASDNTYPETAPQGTLSPR